MSKFQERFRQLKDESGKTQAAIASDLGITQQNFSYYINGREPDYDVLIKISNYFDVSIDFLLGQSDFKTLGANFVTAKDLGFSEKAIKTLTSLVGYKKIKDSEGMSLTVAEPLPPPTELNQILENSKFYSLLNYILTLKNIKQAKFRSEWSMTEVLGGTDEAYEYVLQKAEHLFSDIVKEIAPPPENEQEKFKMTHGERKDLYGK